jgi:hypothetical protein
MNERPAAGEVAEFHLFPRGQTAPAEIGRWELVVTPGTVVTAEAMETSGRFGASGEFEYSSFKGRWEAGGAGCGAGQFFGGGVTFFPSPGRNACRGEAVAAASNRH